MRWGVESEKDRRGRDGEQDKAVMGGKRARHDSDWREGLVGVERKRQTRKLQKEAGGWEKDAGGASRNGKNLL